MWRWDDEYSTVWERWMMRKTWGCELCECGTLNRNSDYDLQTSPWTQLSITSENHGNASVSGASGGPRLSVLFSKISLSSCYSFICQIPGTLSKIQIGKRQENVNCWSLFCFLKNISSFWCLLNISCSVETEAEVSIPSPLLFTPSLRTNRTRCFYFWK